MQEVPWNKAILETFNELAMLSEEEYNIMLTRIRDRWTITKQAYEFGLSVSTVKRRIKALRGKYDAVQKIAPDKLPKRKHSDIEDYMDNN